MCAGRLAYAAAGGKTPKTPAFRLRFADGGALVLTEAGAKKRARVGALPARRDRGRARPPRPGRARARRRTRLAEILAAEPRRLHPLLRDQRALAGIGRAWSNEILHRARLSPVRALDRARRGRGRAARRRRSTRSSPAGSSCASGASPDAKVYRIHNRLGRAVPRMRDADRAGRLRGAHDLLLPGLPDRRAGAQGPPALAAPALTRRGSTRSVSYDPEPRTAPSSTTSRPRRPMCASASRAPASRASRRRCAMRHGDDEALVAAEIDCFVDLDPGPEGRPHVALPGALRGGDRRGRDGRAAPRRAARGAHRASTSSERQQALSRRGQDRRALPARADDARHGAADAGARDADRASPPPRPSGRGGRSASRRPASPPAPARRGSSASSAAGRLAEAGFGAGRHRADPRRSSRSPPTTSAAGARSSSAPSSRIRGEELVDIVERSMSSPIFELLKRPDELFVVEHAHLQPRFVEDVVRHMIGQRARTLRRRCSTTATSSHARQVNFETIHNHDVLAERAGTVGELRARARDRRARAGARPSSETGCRAAPEQARRRSRSVARRSSPAEQAADVAAVQDARSRRPRRS